MVKVRKATTAVPPSRGEAKASVPETGKRKAAAMIPGPIRCATIVCKTLEPGNLMGANGALVYNFPV